MAAIRGLLVQVKDAVARKWQKGRELGPSPIDGQHPFLMRKDLIALIGGT